jgi:hypothetical protein
MGIGCAADPIRSKQVSCHKVSSQIAGVPELINADIGLDVIVSDYVLEDV